MCITYVMLRVHYQPNLMYILMLPDNDQSQTMDGNMHFITNIEVCPFFLLFVLDNLPTYISHMMHKSHCAESTAEHGRMSAEDIYERHLWNSPQFLLGKGRNM